MSSVPLPPASVDHPTNNTRLEIHHFCCGIWSIHCQKDLLMRNAYKTHNGTLTAACKIIWGKKMKIKRPPSHTYGPRTFRYGGKIITEGMLSQFSKCLLYSTLITTFVVAHWPRASCCHQTRLTGRKITSKTSPVGLVIILTGTAKIFK